MRRSPGFRNTSCIDRPASASFSRSPVMDAPPQHIAAARASTDRIGARSNFAWSGDAAGCSVAGCGREGGFLSGETGPVVGMRRKSEMKFLRNRRRLSGVRRARRRSRYHAVRRPAGARLEPGRQGAPCLGGGCYARRRRTSGGNSTCSTLFSPAISSLNQRQEYDNPSPADATNLPSGNGDNVSFTLAVTGSNQNAAPADHRHQCGNRCARDQGRQRHDGLRLHRAPIWVGRQFGQGLGRR